MRYSITALLIAVAFATLGGCGQTGPLYMPTEDVPKPPRAESANSAEQPTKDS